MVARVGSVVAVMLLVWLVGAFDDSAVVAQSQKPMALVGGTLIDGTGATPIRNSVVLIRGDRIERVGTIASLPVPNGYERVSTEGMTVLPGLWDLHVHLIYNGHPNPGAWFKHAADFERVTIPASARQMLMGGVTSVRDMAAPADAIFSVKKRIAAGEIPGSTIYAAGPALAKMAPGAPTPTSQFLPIADAADARMKTRQLLDQGADLIKMFFSERMAPEERSAIITEAHARGKKVAMHGQNDAEVHLGLQMGIDDFQHIGVDSPEYAPDILASLRERVKNGPPLLDADGWCQQLVERRLHGDQARDRGRPGGVSRIAGRARHRDQAGLGVVPATRAAPRHRDDRQAENRATTGSGSDAALRQRRGERWRARAACDLDGCRLVGPRARHGSDDGAPANDAGRRQGDGSGSR